MKNKKNVSYPLAGYDVVLDAYEQEIEDALKKSRPKPMRSTALAKLKRQLKQIAHNTIAKNKSVTFRVNAWDIERLKARAMQEGLPYQTLLSSIVHKYVSGTLK